MDDAEQLPITVTAQQPVVYSFTNEAGTQIAVTVDVTNTSGRAIAVGEIGLWIEAEGTQAQVTAREYLPQAGIEDGATETFTGVVQADPGDWQVQVRITDSAAYAVLQDLGTQPLVIEGTVAPNVGYDHSQHFELAVHITHAERIGGECRLHYAITNHSASEVPAGMPVIATISDGTGTSTQVYHYTEALPPHQTQPRYLTLELTEFTHGEATATIGVDLAGESAAQDEATLVLHADGQLSLRH